MDPKLNPPQIVMMPTRHFAGPVRHYTMDTRGEIPAQWNAYNMAEIGVAEAKPGYYGLVFDDDDDGFAYMCGQEIDAGAALPEGFQTVSLHGRYARFATMAPLATMDAVWGEIYGYWLVSTDLKPRSGPTVEYYLPGFEVETGEGGFEIWVAVEG